MRATAAPYTTFTARMMSHLRTSRKSHHLQDVQTIRSLFGDPSPATMETSLDLPPVEGAERKIRGKLVTVAHVFPTPVFARSEQLFQFSIAELALARFEVCLRVPQNGSAKRERLIPH